MPPPTDADQVRREIKEVDDQCAAIDSAAKAGKDFKKMQQELLGRLDRSTGIAQTPDYSEPKYDKQRKAFDDALDECKRLLDA